MVTRLSGRKVLVMGFARQGQSLARWLPTQGARVTVNDAKTQEQLQVNLSEYGEVRFVLGGHPLDLLDVTDLICVSGGVPLTLPFLEVAQNMRIPLTNDAQLFMERVSAPVIGITGSAGKTTTTTLVGEMLKKAGIPTHVGGNIGYVLLDELPSIQPSDWVVMELSSFQLELMTTSPHIAAILNVTPNHLDRHGTMEAYTHAKAQIIAHQRAGDVAVLSYDDFGANALHERVQGELVWFSLDSMVSDGAFLMGERLMLVGRANPNQGANVICERGDILLRGDHNVRNVLAACAIAGSAGVSVEVMYETIRHFNGVAHRQEWVRTHNGVMWENDSIATAPERVLAALKSYHEPVILLLGGADKKLPWQTMLQLAHEKSRHIIAFGGSAGDIVVQTLTEMGYPHHVTRVSTLSEAVDVAHQIAQAGDVVLLSPGGTSYDAYPDFTVRGQHFRELVAALL